MKQNYKEFRCGNLVEFEGEVYEIYGISSEFPILNTIKFGVGVVTWDNIKPIELTEEWVLKFGFIMLNNNDFPINGWFEKKYLTNEHEPLITSWVSIMINLNSNSCVICDENPDEMGANTKMPIKYVHQLQNLFHSLTNEELTIINDK